MKKMFLFILLLIPVVTQASNNIVFQCTTSNGKVISVKRLGKFYEYRFGFPNKAPELVFKNHISLPRVYHHEREINSNSNLPTWFDIGFIELFNYSYVYKVYALIDEGEDTKETHKYKLGLIVKKDDKLIAEFLCNDKKDIILNWAY